MAGRLPPLPTVSEIVKLYRLTARKNLSQNFLLNMNVNRKLVKTAGSLRNGYVCEVGPGPGGITRAILEKDIKGLVVIEKDQRFLPGLELVANASSKTMKIVHGDILDFNMENIFPKSEIKPWNDDPPNCHIIGNLPFNVSLPLLIRWLEDISNHSGAWRFGRTKLTLVFQKEVTDRITAPIVTRPRCRLSVMCQYLCHVEKKFIIKGETFVPSPDVDAGVVQFTPRQQPLIDGVPFKLVEKLVHHVFHHRNKHIKFGIDKLFPPDKSHWTEELLRVAEVNPTSTSFMLSVGEIGRLCYLYKEICDKDPDIFPYDYRKQKASALSRAHKKQREAEQAENDSTEATIKQCQSSDSSLAAL